MSKKINTVELAKSLTHTTEATNYENPLPPPNEPTLSDEQNVKTYCNVLQTIVTLTEMRRSLSGCYNNKKNKIKFVKFLPTQWRTD